MAADPNVTPSVPTPVSSHPNRVGSGRNSIVATNPHISAAGSNRPVTRQPNVIRPRNRRDYLHLRWRRHLFRDHWAGRCPRLRWHVNHLAFNTAGPEGYYSTHGNEQ